MTQDRGFLKLKGKTIKAVDTACVNHIVILCEDGTVFDLSADMNQIGYNVAVPYLELRKRRGKLEKLPRKKKEKVEWPSPVITE